MGKNAGEMGVPHTVSIWYPLFTHGAPRKDVMHTLHTAAASPAKEWFFPRLSRKPSTSPCRYASHQWSGFPVVVSQVSALAVKHTWVDRSRESLVFECWVQPTAYALPPRHGMACWCIRWSVTYLYGGVFVGVLVVRGCWL